MATIEFNTSGEVVGFLGDSSCPTCGEPLEPGRCPDCGEPVPVPTTRKWDVQEHKIWKGLDPVNPVWGNRGFACSSWDDANRLLNYILKSNKSLVLRVAPTNGGE